MSNATKSHPAPQFKLSFELSPETIRILEAKARESGSTLEQEVQAIVSNGDVTGAVRQVIGDYVHDYVAGAAVPA